MSLRSNTDREVRVALGNDTARLPLSPRWRRYVFTLRPTKNETTTLRFAVGKEDAPIWIDSVYVFKGDANVFKREFDRGLVLANATPKSKTIKVGSGYRRIAGNQDPAVNNGKAVTEVTLPPYDGLVLIKTGATGGGGSGSGSGFIGDLVWRDKNGNGKQDSGEPGWEGIKIDLITSSGSRIASTTSGADGSYAFKNLGPGRYRIAVTAPSGAKFSPKVSGGATNSDIDPDTGQSWCATITDAGETRRSIDVGFVPDGGSGAGGGARIGDFVWKDKNGDGIQNNAEPGVSKVKVKLRTCNGIYRETTFTDASGGYEFTGLPREKFLVQFILPDGAKFSPARRGSKRGKDSDADPSTGYSGCYDLDKNADRGGVDAGLRF